MKPQVRVINCARGGLVDEGALYNAIKEGRVAGAALDVFETEPPAADHPLLSLEEVIATPHLGASTKEAQEGVAVTVAEQMRDYFLTGALRGAVNVPAMGAHELTALQPYLALAERLGRFQAQLIDGAVREVGIEYAGDVAGMDIVPLTRAFVAGLLRDMSARVNVVNALLIAEERGITVTSSFKRAGANELLPALRTVVASGNDEHIIAGALFGARSDGRVTEIDGFRIEVIPSGYMLVTRSSDVPGVVGRIGTKLGESGINISHFHLGRRERGGEAISVIETDAPLGEQTLKELRAFEQIISTRQIDFGS